MFNVQHVTGFRNPRQIIAENATLTAAFRHVLTYNSSQLAPYHNTWHMMCVLKYVDYIIRMEKSAGHYAPEDELDETALMLAALFHDINHSAGKLADDYNVENAKVEFKNFLDYEDYAKAGDDINPGWMKNRVYALLDATQYPYVMPHSELTHDQKIIRDADMMQAYEPNMFFHLVLGLSAESGKPIIKVLEQNVKFHADLVMCTRTGAAFRDAHRPMLIDEFNRYAELLS